MIAKVRSILDHTKKTLEEATRVRSLRTVRQDSDLIKKYATLIVVETNQILGAEQSSDGRAFKYAEGKVEDLLKSLILEGTSK
jgi:histidinol phosphatase-like enzyme